MPRTDPWLRVFAALLLAVIPPILLLVGALILTESVLRTADPSLVAVVVVVGAVIWAAVLGLLFSRAMASDIRSALSLAERGEPMADPDVGREYQQLATTLEERNRQITTLAREAGAVSIDDEPQRVLASLVSAVRSVMRDPTWRCAVLASDQPELLPAGVYDAAEDTTTITPIGDLEQWASVSLAGAQALRIDGPWGAFAVADVAVSDRLRAVLYAPWEGRADPTPAEIALLSLVGQQFRTALDHSLLYATVRRQADELNRMAAIQADFLRGVTHDLQTPLTSIGALATELRAGELLPPGAREDLEAIAHQAERLRRMVGQLLVASRLEAGVLRPQTDVFAVPPLVERTWSALRANRPFQLTVDGPPHLAVGDADRLEQVLWALLDNAVKYSPAGSPIAVRVSSDPGKLAITVRDQGLGMDAQTSARAFEQFFRADDARRLAPDGSGVGLYAARGLTEAMGGTIHIESTPGLGSSVTVQLPAEPSEVGE